MRKMMAMGREKHKNENVQSFVKTDRTKATESEEGHEKRKEEKKICKLYSLPIKFISNIVFFRHDRHK